MDLAPILKKRRREIVMGVALLGVLAFFLYSRAGGTTGSASEEATLVTGPPANVEKAMAKMSSVKIPAVLLERLSDEKVAYDPSQRNIFRYGNIPPKPPSKEELAAIEAAKKAAEDARQAAMQAALDAQKKQAEALEAAAKNQPPIDPATGLPVGVTPPPPPKPVPPAITLRYSGYLGSEQNKMAVLYNGEDMLLARSGDVLEKQFKVLDIGYDWVKIGYVDPQFADQYQKLRMGQ